MTIRINCRCGRYITLDRGLAGKRIRCPECAVILQVPKDPREKVRDTPSEASSPAWADSYTDSETMALPPRRRVSSPRVAATSSPQVIYKYLGVMAIAMSVVFIAMIALPKLTQQMQALSHRILPEPKNLGPFDIEPSLVSIPTNPWTFHLGKFAFQFPIDFQPYNSKANSIEFVRDTPELRATNGEMLTWYSIHSLPPKEVAPFTREWYNIEQKRLEAISKPLQA
jgi:hypothetical protein